MAKAGKRMPASLRKRKMAKAGKRMPASLQKRMVDMDIRKLLRPASWALRGKITYCEDGLATINNSSFVDEERFAKAYAIAAKENTIGTPTLMHWRAKTICWAASHAKALGGDFVECGVYRGFLSRVAMEYIGFAGMGQKFYLLDTYEGAAQEGANFKASHYEPTYDAVAGAFAPFKNAVIVKGMVPETLPLVQSERVAYLHLDMNNPVPEMAAAGHFWGRMPVGGVIISDDYGFPTYEKTKKAFDDFAKSKGTCVLPIPTGQGILIKV
ncbi:MAG: class I SAM-dependent methyltransferase [Candidatus Micrarchaeia archaeon]|jgi:hypothetical protein